jgi:hypothetical protein
MKQRTVMTILTFVLIGFFSAGVSVSADDIKTRMKKRLPVIKELKAKGIDLSAQKRKKRMLSQLKIKTAKPFMRLSPSNRERQRNLSVNGVPCKLPKKQPPVSG